MDGHGHTKHQAEMSVFNMRYEKQNFSIFCQRAEFQT